VSHRSARLTVHGRRLLVERVAAGRAVAHVAAEMGVSRATGYKWVRRDRLEGEAGLVDRPSRPHTSPRRTNAEQAAALRALGRNESGSSTELRQIRDRPAELIRPASGPRWASVHP
jgi:transposase